MEGSLLAGLQAELPLKLEQLELSASCNKVGLVIVDEVNGFCSVGYGNLAPQSPDAQTEKMVKETAKLAKEFSARGWPLLAFIDTHDPAKPEHPYPPHCLAGSGEDELVPELKWLEDDENATLLRKDCFDGFIGGVQPDGTNVVVEWIKKNQIQQMVVVGTCTDICVLDFVCTVLSARNHGLVSPLEEVVVYSEACSTFSIPAHVAHKVGAIAHPQDVAHHMGLYMAAGRGAKIVDRVVLKDAPAVVRTNGVHAPVVARANGVYVST